MPHLNSFFKELFEYNYTVNKKLIAAMNEQANKVPEKSIRWMSHLLNAHHIWNHRIESKQPIYGVWEVHSIADFEKMNEDNYNDTLRILDNTELTGVLKYKTSKGDSFSDTVQTILFQVINHYSYHRGQIASNFRESGLEPVATDYIFYKRTN